MQFQAQLKTLLMSYISIAHAFLGEEKTKSISVDQYQRLVVLLAECIELDYVMDKTIAKHAIEQLDATQRPEEAVMHCFALYVYKLCDKSSKHPLEEGVIKQKIINILPMFESALNQGLITLESYDKNADALAHIADKTEEVPALLEALANEYQRLA